MENFKKLTKQPLFLPIFCMILVLLINLIKSPAFFSIKIQDGVLFGRLIDILNRGSEIAILAVGQTLVVAVSAGTDISVGGVFGALIAEVILTFIFVYVILNATDEEAGNSKIAGLIIGLTLTLVHLVGIGITGTSVNPARSLATAITSGIFFESTEALKQVFIFIIAPLIGGCLAALLHMFLVKDTKEEVKEVKETEVVEETTEEKDTKKAKAKKSK